MKYNLLLIILLLSALLVFSGCSAQAAVPSESAEPRDCTPVVLLPEKGVSGRVGAASLDSSHSSDGYILLNYEGKNENVKIQVTDPNGVEYLYQVSVYEKDICLPLCSGSGAYKVKLLESIGVKDNYAVSGSAEVNAEINDSFSPFLRPNYYTDYSEETKAVELGQTLTEGCTSDLGAIEAIYRYVTNTITYDYDKAASVRFGYRPDVDEVLSTKKGICWDYASLMVCMLRTQRIPTRLEVGYVDTLYHAWISCYADGVGWVDGIIRFDGENWSLLDPTLDASRTRAARKNHREDSYILQFTY